MEYYDKAFDRITTRNERPLKSIKRIFHTVTTTDDPVIRKVRQTLLLDAEERKTSLSSVLSNKVLGHLAQTESDRRYDTVICGQITEPKAFFWHVKAYCVLVSIVIKPTCLHIKKTKTTGGASIFNFTVSYILK